MTIPIPGLVCLKVQVTRISTIGNRDVPGNGGPRRKMDSDLRRIGFNPHWIHVGFLRIRVTRTPHLQLRISTAHKVKFEAALAVS